MLRAFSRVCLTLFLVAWAHLACAQSNIIGGGIFGDVKKAGASLVMPLFSRSNGGSNSTTTQYFAFANGSASVSTAIRETPAAVAGTITKLIANYPTGAGTGTYTITLRKNGADTALTCQIVSAATQCTDTTDSVSFNPGDTYGYKVVPTSTPTSNSEWEVAAVFTGASASLLSMSDANPSNSAVNYLGVTYATAFATTEANASSLMPTGGTVDQFYVAGSAAPGAGLQWVYSIFKNGSNTGITCTISGASTTSCNDTSDSMTYSLNDTISFELCPGTVSGGVCTPSGTPAVSNARFGFRWRPTNTGEVPVFAATSAPNASSARFYAPSAGAPVSVEAGTVNLTPIAMTVKKLVGSVSTAPGGATSRTVVLRSGTGSGQSNAGTPGTETCTITSASTSCPQDTTNTYSSSVGTLLDWDVTVSGANAASTWFRLSGVVTVP